MSGVKIQGIKELEAAFARTVKQMPEKLRAFHREMEALTAAVDSESAIAQVEQKAVARAEALVDEIMRELEG